MKNLMLETSCIIIIFNYSNMLKYNDMKTIGQKYGKTNSVSHLCFNGARKLANQPAPKSTKKSNQPSKQVNPLKRL